MLNKITIFLSDIFRTNQEIITLLIISIITAFVMKIINTFLTFINNKTNHKDKQKYIINKRNKNILTIIYIIVLICIWNDLLNNIITFISFISAAITLALREIIYNYFAGLYIKVIKPINIEDRIQIKEYIGDVININSLNFEILEVDTDTNQSTGKILNIPNSLIFTSPLKNYNKAFKYIWDEITIRIDANNNIEFVKKQLMKIINSNQTIKEIPKKMKEEVKKSMSSYRIYYNNYLPIIYTKIEEDKCLLTIRFLIHPKKQRNIESDIYNKILLNFKKNNIELK